MAIDSAEMGGWSIDATTREFIPSPRLKELFGFHLDEPMTFESAIAQVDSEYQSLLRNTVEAAIDRGEICDVEFPLKGFHDGKLRWVRANGNLTYDLDGKPAYFTGLMLDVTVHKQDDIRKTDFIAMASHELKTPLTTLQAYVQMLAAKADKSGDTFAAGALDKANIQVKKMSALINGFLSASSFEAGKIYLNEQSFEMNTLLKEIVEDTMLITKSHYIVVTSDCDIVVRADRDKIGQVITNFLSNAIKYSSKGKNITVSCREIKGLVEVSITDEGLGIAPQDHAKLFDRYYRIESEQTQNISGFGLGLYLSAEIIQRHKGKVWVESEMDKGSTFYFSLPLA